MSANNEKEAPPTEPQNATKDNQPPSGSVTPPGDAPEVKKKREYKDFGHEEEKATRALFHFFPAELRGGEGREHPERVFCSGFALEEREEGRRQQCGGWKRGWTATSS